MCICKMQGGEIIQYLRARRCQEGTETWMKTDIREFKGSLVRASDGGKSAKSLARAECFVETVVVCALSRQTFQNSTDSFTTNRPAASVDCGIINTAINRRGLIW